MGPHMTDPQTLTALRNAARSGTSRRHAAQLLGISPDDTQTLNAAAAELQTQTGAPDTLLDWDTYAAQERARYRLAQKTRRLTNDQP